MLRNLEEVYFPESLQDVVAKRAEYGDAAAPIAGGTDIVPQAPPGIKCLIDLNRLGLNYIREEDGKIHIGATTTMQELSASALVAGMASGILNSSCCQGWPRQVRNAATIGGNLVSAGPFADTPPALLALDATAVIVDQRGETEIPLDEFFLDYRQTAVGSGILKEIVLPATQRQGRGVFLRFARTEIDTALVNAAVSIQFDGSKCSHVRIALGAMGRTCRRIKEAEQVLLNEALTPESAEKVAEIVTNIVEPVLDFRASADYRREISGVLVRRALQELACAS